MKKFNKEDEYYVYYLVGQNLRKQRKLKHLTVAKFSQMCNYSEGFIMNIESANYKQTYSLGTIWHFCNVLGIDIKVLFDPIDEKK